MYPEETNTVRSAGTAGYGSAKNNRIDHSVGSEKHPRLSGFDKELSRIEMFENNLGAELMELYSMLDRFRILAPEMIEGVEKAKEEGSMASLRIKDVADRLESHLTLLKKFKRELDL